MPNILYIRVREVRRPECYTRRNVQRTPPAIKDISQLCENVPIYSMQMYRVRTYFVCNDFLEYVVFYAGLLRKIFTDNINMHIINLVTTDIYIFLGNVLKDWNLME